MYLSFLWRIIRMIAVWWNGTCLGCRWDAPAALPVACVGATSNVWICSFSMWQSMLDERFMCEAWCFRAGWNWWPEPCYILQLPTCSTELQFVELLWILWGSLHKTPDLMTKVRSIPSILYFLYLIFHMKLTLLPHLAWLQYLLQWHSSSFFFYCYDIVF